MNILHISTIDQAGAGICAVRLNNALISEGCNSRLLVLHKTRKADSNIWGVSSDISDFLHRALHKILRMAHIYVCEEDVLIKKSIACNACFSRPVTGYDISNHPYIQWADVIHLHWVDNFFNQPKFFKQVRKPVVWTIHDEGLFFGISHYGDMFDVTDDLEKKYLSIKRKMVEESDNINFVFLTENFRRKFSNQPILKNKHCHVIPNSVDENVFYPHNRKQIRQQLGINDDEILLSFVATEISDPHKGFENLIAALALFDNTRKIKVLAIGYHNNIENNDRVIYIGTVKDQDYLSQLFSASDYYVMASLQESFSQTCIEAMACGIPVVSTPTGVANELIDEANGILCNGFSALDIKSALELAFAHDYNSDVIRNKVILTFSPKVVAKQYERLYYDVCK